MKNRLIQSFKKIFIIIVLIITIVNVFSWNPFYNKSYAEESSTSSGSYVDDYVDGVTGLVLYPMKILPLVCGKLLNMILALFSGNGLSITLGDIIFNKIEITKLDFFNFNSKSEAANSIRKSVAVWYYSFRNLAAVILFGILLYTGIRMATTTIAEEKARYSEMLVNWVESIALLFVLHYLIQFIIVINNQLVDIFANSYKHADLAEPMNEMFHNAIFSIGFTKGAGSSVCYVLLVGMTFVFLLSYLKRMVTIGFLIVISPLVTITYSVDKMNDGKSQALNIWFKEFAYNVLIQPFHCLSYLFLVDTGISILIKEKSMAAIIIATLMVYFMYASEKIIRHIFHFRSDTMSDTISHAAFVSTAIGTFSGMRIKNGNKYADYAEPSEEDVSNNEITKAEKRNVEARKANDNYNMSNTENELKRKSNINYQSPQSRTSNANANRKPRKKNSRVGRVISAVATNPVLAGYARVNKTLGKAILAGGLSLATGNAPTFVANETAVMADSIAEAKKASTSRRKIKLQQTYRNAEEYKKQRLTEIRVKEELNKEQKKAGKEFDAEEKIEKENKIRSKIERDEGEEISQKAHDYMENRISELAHGAEPQNTSEKKLTKDINKLRMSYANQGMKEEDINSEIEDDITNVKKGEYNKEFKIVDDILEVKDTAVNAGKVIASPITDVKKYYRYKKNSYVNQNNINNNKKDKS